MNDKAEEYIWKKCKSIIDMLLEKLPEIDQKNPDVKNLIEQAKEIYRTDIVVAYTKGRITGNKMKYGIEYLNKLEDYMEEGKDYYRKTYEQ
jgi:GTP-sensing pleiotropic transcriptional regulator CodY